MIHPTLSPMVTVLRLGELRQTFEKRARAAETTGNFPATALWLKAADDVASLQMEARRKSAELEKEVRKARARAEADRVEDRAALRLLRITLTRLKENFNPACHSPDYRARLDRALALALDGANMNEDEL